jgi:hypothetical protein
VYGDRGIKDLDIYLFYELPRGRSASHFPWNRGGSTRNRDFGDSALGRQLYTAKDWTDSKLAPKVPNWDLYSGRRVDIISRAIAPHPEGAKSSVRQWLERGRDRRHAPGSSDWNLSRTPVVCLYPEMAEVWWTGLEVDEAGIEKGAYGAEAARLPTWVRGEKP